VVQHQEEMIGLRQFFVPAVLPVVLLFFVLEHHIGVVAITNFGGRRIGALQDGRAILFEPGPLVIVGLALLPHRPRRL